MKNVKRELSQSLYAKEYAYRSGFRSYLDAEVWLYDMLGDDFSYAEKPRVATYYNNDGKRRFAVVLTDTSL